MKGIDININHVNRIFELTELNLEWFKRYHSNEIPTYSFLLERNCKRIAYYCTVNLLGKYTEKDIDNKLDRMFESIEVLEDITLENKKKQKKYIYIKKYKHYNK